MIAAGDWTVVERKLFSFHFHKKCYLGKYFYLWQPSFYWKYDFVKFQSVNSNKMKNIVLNMAEA